MRDQQGGGHEKRHEAALVDGMPARRMPSDVRILHTCPMLSWTNRRLM